MAPPTPAPLRTPGRLLRALAGLALLLALIAGLPLLLLKVGHQPSELTGGWHLLTQQDDGSLLLVVLTLIGWAAWAAFTASAILETAALLRGRSARRIRGLGGLQSLAGFLIGSIVLLAPTAASAATPAPAVAATGTHAAGTASPSPTATAKASSDTATWPTHTVASATEAPWDLAVTYLGDGQRWKDIAALNPDVPHISAGDQYLPQGAVIKLPADARTTPNTPAATPPTPAAPNTPSVQGTGGNHAASQATEHTVRDGENLSLIAQEAYGDPAQWPTVFEANKGEVQPGGRHFTDPDLIYPGQHLTLPHTNSPITPTAPPAEPTNPTPVPPSPPSHTTPPQQSEKPTPAATPEQDNSKDTEGTTATATPSATAPAPSRTAAPVPAPSTDTDHSPAATTDSSSDSEDLAPAAVWAGAGALATALIGTLGTRRILQQRRRRPGRRIPMPEGRAAATEQGLRAAQHPSGFTLLDTALRSLALNLAATGRDLPAITAVVLHDAKVELHLASELPSMKPFSTAPGRMDLWICTASSPDLADDHQLANADAPYPALASIGWDSAGHLVLIDLEHIGILNLTGNDDFARHVLQAIAVELANTPLPGHLEVTTLANTAPGLDTAAPERVAHIADLETATTELASHTDDQRHALSAVGAPSLRTARLLDDAAGAWTPHILLAGPLPDNEHRTRLFETLTTDPRTAGAVITSSPTADLPATAWTLECLGPDHTIALPGSNLPIKLQGLGDAHFRDAIELLTLAASDRDVPAPDWTRTPDEHDLDVDDHDPEPSGHHQSAPTDTATTKAAVSSGTEETDEGAADEDGMPSEYAEPEQDNNGTGDAPLPHSTGETTAPAPAADNADHRNNHEPEGESTGPSLAEVLAEEDGQEDTPAAVLTGTEMHGGPARASGAAAPAPASCTAHAKPTITIPAPATGPADADGTPAAAATDTTPGRPQQTATHAAGPTVLLLGPISIEGANGRIDSSRRSAGIELTAFLALNPGVDHHGIDDALWPGRLVNKQMRNAVISRTRSWLGKDTDGNAYLPRVQDTGDSRYRLAPTVTCDWTLFQRFAHTGLGRHNEDGDLALRRALSLVRGRPFTGIAPQRYAWAEPATQEMVSAVVDVAYELSTRRRKANDIPGALWAAKRGLLAAEESELLHRQIFLAHHATGDIDALREAASRLIRINEQLLGGVDMEAETAELLRNLLPRPLTRSR
ncbi:hypothetical protein ACIA78_31945 [Streptomyces xanthochromogenes]|uniref:hypothetical protein n=1 Tax=Streptomyces xanthochromogenes TaxID=67384 RepID=UPI0037A5C876